MDWHKEKVSENLTVAQQKQKHIDYFQTFYASDSGRHCLCDIKSFIEQQVIDTPEIAFAKLALLKLYDYIKESAGVVDQSAVIDAEMIVASQYKVEEEHEQKEGMYDV